MASSKIQKICNHTATLPRTRLFVALALTTASQCLAALQRQFATSRPRSGGVETLMRYCEGCSVMTVRHVRELQPSVLGSRDLPTTGTQNGDMHQGSLHTVKGCLFKEGGEVRFASTLT